MTTSETILKVSDLAVATVAGGQVLKGVSLQVSRGEVLALIGASGSGKTTLALAALGHLRPGLELRSGTVELCGSEVFQASVRQRQSFRARQVAYVAQSAAAAFNPRIRLREQVIESALIHRRQRRTEAELKAEDLFRYLNLPAASSIGRRFPAQVSGGQLQRFMIAMGMQEDPVLLVCDEPTSALDVTTQVEVMRLLKRVIREKKTSALFVSHDLAVVAQIATRIAVMRSGHIVEIGSTEQIINSPKEPYTRELLGASKHLSLAGLPSSVRESPAEKRAVISVHNVFAGYGPLLDGRPQITTLHDVSFSVNQSEIAAVIGESGSGKTTLARVIAGLHAPASRQLSLMGKSLAARSEKRSALDRRRIQLVMQMADTALNPKHTVRRIIGRVLEFFDELKGQPAEDRMIELLNMVRLPATYLDRRPTELSGGEKQRVNLARALAANPTVLICDEITSALDTIVAGQIVDLVRRLREELSLTIIFISHDLATVASIADRVTVLQRGRVVEAGETHAVLGAPRKPYTQLLRASVPDLRVGWLEDATAVRDRLAAESAATATAAL